jgi:hypothetical protein
MNDNNLNPIACTLPSEKFAKRRKQIIERLFQKTIERHELEDGFEFVFPDDGQLIAELTEFVRFERDCCAFLTFELIFDPQRGPIHLRCRGPEGAKEAVRRMFT